MQTSAVPTATTPQHLSRLGSPLLTRATSPQDRRVWFRLVTRDVDRHGTIIEPSGVDLSSFKLNPVFLWMHDSGGGETTPSPDVVIGRVVDYEQTFDHLDVCAEFDDDGADGLASTCLRKVRDGFLRMVSIGCNVVEETATRVGDSLVPTFSRTELLECSLVIVGSNRKALKLDRAAVAAELRSALAQPRVKRGDQVATCAVFNRAGEMLWGKRRDNGKYTTPGGHFAAGEGPHDAARRELREEAGIEASQLDYVGVMDNGVAGDGHVFVHVFKVDNVDATPNSEGDPDREVETWEWVPLDKGSLPSCIAESLHAPRNAHIELGVCRMPACREIGGAGGDVGTQAVLSDIVEKSATAAPAQRAVIVDGTDVNTNAKVDVNTDSLLGDDAAGSSGNLTVKSESPMIQNTPLSRNVVPFKSFPVVEGKWDADAAVSRWRRWASKDGSGKPESMDWKKYAECFCWFDSDKPEAFGSYSLPHHDIRDGKPVTVWQGVVAAAAAISGSRGGVKGIPADDIAKIKSHLGQHYKAFDKTPPWDAKERTAERADFYLPVPVVPAFSLLNDVSGIEQHDRPDLVPHALLFSSALFKSADNVTAWCEAHGYASTPQWEVGSGYSHDGLVVSENSYVVEQIPLDSFDSRQGLTTISLAEGVSLVVGTLNSWGQNSLRRKAAVAKLRSSIAQAADSRAVSDAWPNADPQDISDLLKSLTRSHNLVHYLVPESNQRAATATRSAAQTTEPIKMKRSPESRMAYRAMISHALEGAEMHARAMDDGICADEHRALHHSMAMRSLDHADELHGIMRAVFIGDTASQDVVVDGVLPEQGEIFNVPASRSQELTARFTEVATKVGRLPRSLRSIVASELGTSDSDIVEEKLMGMKADRSSLIELRRASVDATKRIDKAETDKAIEEALDAKLISPADAKRMRGLDPATGVVKSEAWGRARVERFISERREVGPIADVVRPGVERTVQPQVERTVAANAANAVQIRTGRALTSLSQAQVAQRTAEIAAGLGINVDNINAKMAEASEVQSTDVEAALGKVRSIPSA